MICYNIVVYNMCIYIYIYTCTYISYGIILQVVEDYVELPDSLRLAPWEVTVRER